MKQNTDQYQSQSQYRDQSQSRKGGFNTMRQALEHENEYSHDRDNQPASEGVLSSFKSAYDHGSISELGSSISELGTMIRGKLPSGTKMAWAVAAGLVLSGGTFLVYRNRKSIAKTFTPSQTGRGRKTH